MVFCTDADKGMRSSKASGRRPVAEAHEGVEGGPAWAIDQLLTVPDSQLYATAAAASSCPNLQVICWSYTFPSPFQPADSEVSKLSLD